MIKELTKLINSWFELSIYNQSVLSEDLQVEILRKIIKHFHWDYKRYFNNDETIIVHKITNQIELQAILLYRIARECSNSLNNQDKALSYSNLGKFLTGIEIYHSADIGVGLKISHGVGTVIGSHSVIGDNCTIYQGVTIGNKSRLDNRKAIIGNNVTLFAGSKVLGKIKIGDHSIIGANAVCMKDVPQNKTAVGIPARII